MNHQKHLRSLLKSAITPHVDESSPFESGFYSGRIPDEFLTEELVKTKEPSLTIYGKDFILFEKSVELLRKDPRTEYLKDNELNNMLWNLVCEIFTDSEKFKNNNELVLRIKTFLEDICRPLEEYEVIFKIKNLNIKEEIKVLDSFIINCTRENLRRKGFDHPDEFFSKAVDDFEKQTLLLVIEKGNNSSLVRDRARQKGNEIVKFLQAYLSEMPFVVNEQLLFSLSEEYVIKKKNISQIISIGGNRGFNPIKFDYENEFSRLTGKVNKHNEMLKTSSDNLKNCVKRTITWIGKAVSEEDFDLKVAFLCTALETLLTTKQDGRKGEKIAYRTALLQKHFKEYITPPRQILGLYQIRSSVVHGSRIGIASKFEYNTLLKLTRDMLDYFIQFINRYPVKKQTDVLNLLIKSEYTIELTDWLKSYPDKNSNEIAKSLEEDNPDSK